jgi:sialic acid synthase
MVRDIRNLEVSFGVNDIIVPSSIKEAKVKLERSVASLKELKEGHVLTEDDIHLLSPGDGVKWQERWQLIGKRLTKAIQKDEIIYIKDVE